MADKAMSDIQQAADFAIDPVCGMKVALKPGGRMHTFPGETYYFCSQKCLDKFAQEPSKYAASAQPPESRKGEVDDKTTPGAIEYTCPMRPEIVRRAPGSCPICAQ